MASDIYVSYVLHDDGESAVKKFVELFKQKMKVNTGRRNLTEDMDFTEMKLDARTKFDITERVNNSHILLAFLSPSFFTEDRCGLEWDLFYRKQKNQTTRIIYPILIGELVDPKTTFDIRRKLDDEQLKRLKQAEDVGTLNWIEIRNDVEQSEQSLQELTKRIDVALDQIKPFDRRIKNYHVINREVEIKGDHKRYEEIKKAIGNQQRAFPQFRPVCVIYTGGTVGQVRQEELNRNSPLKTGDIEEVITSISKIKELEFDIDFYSYRTPIDSSNITSEDWIGLAEIIEELYIFYQGFVILHGANTMAYTASALSFMFENLNKPIILTGAEIPLVELNTDAETNILRAIQAAAPSLPSSVGNIPEVCILYGNSLIRGNRATKMSSLSTTHGFYSPNYGELAYVAHDRLDLQHRLLRKVDTSIDDPLEVKRALLKDNVEMWDVYPDQNIETFKALCNRPLAGLIIRTYGTGNAPEGEFIDELEKLVQRNVIVMNLTQCPAGRVELRLFETNARLFDIGVINGGDMVREAAYCKLKYLLGNYSGDLERIRMEMQINLRGELTDSSYSVKFDGDGSEVAPIYRGTSKVITYFDPLSINNAVLRIKGIKVKQMPRTETNTDLAVRVYLNRNNIQVQENEEDERYRIAYFSHRLEFGTDYEVVPISQNLEVTEKVRKLIRSDTRHIALQIVSDNGHAFTFDSMQLTILTRDT